MSSGPLAHQFDDLQQQHEAADLGMWTFLATEVLFFGALFTGYAVYRFLFPHAFAEGSRELLMWIGATNTGILLISSLTVALAVHEAEAGANRAVALLLAATVVLGIAFLSLKGYEYYMDWHHELIPNLRFEYHGEADPAHVKLFMTLYFIMTGFHALHMFIGIALMGVMLIMALRGRFSPEHHPALELSGLYWHFVDIIWIFLFPLLYLVR